MRLKIELTPLKYQSININYNYPLSSLCYTFLNKSNIDFANKLHNEGFKVGNKNFKLFTYSQLFCKLYEIKDAFITFKDRVTWYVSSPIDNFILYFAQTLLSECTITVNNLKFEVINVEVMKQPEFKSKMLFKCLSPIAVNTGAVVNGEFKQYYLSVEDEKFKENIKNNLLRKYFALTNKLPHDLNFHMRILNIDKCNKGKRINIKNSFIKGYMPIFEVSGSTELIMTGYETGYGSKNSMGCGMVEVYCS